MPYFPGTVGIAAFAGAKLCGYTAAGAALRRAYPKASVRPFWFGLARTLTGVCAGLLNLFLWIKILAPNFSDDQTTGFLISLIAWRVLIWTLLIWYFCDREIEPLSRFLFAVVSGVILSFILDALGIWLAFVSPGGIPVC